MNKQEYKGFPSKTELSRFFSASSPRSPTKSVYIEFWMIPIISILRFAVEDAGRSATKKKW